MKSLSSTHLQSTDISANNNINNNNNNNNDQNNNNVSTPSLDSILPTNKNIKSIKETNKITLSYDPINKLQILNQFEIIREIGVGMHSKVKLAYDLSLKKPVAVKIMNRKEKKRSKFKFEQNFKIRQEINCLKLINKHSNIIKLFEVLDDFQSRKIYLIMEYCPKGEIKWCNDTENELDAKGPPQWSFQRVREMIRDVILGLEYLHNKGIIHRDIKPANLLISNNNIVKISDFSISVIMNQYIHTPTTEHNKDFLQIIKTEGTPAFFAPEICLGNEIWNKFNILRDNEQFQNENYFISTKIDTWALGITTYCLLFGMLPFTSKFELKLFDKIINEPVQFPEYSTIIHNNISNPTSIQEYELAKDFISKLLIKNPLDRLSTNDCKNHGFICFDFNNTIINDSRTKDLKLQQKLKFLTKQIITLPLEDNDINDHKDFIYPPNNTDTNDADDMVNKGHKMESFLSPITSPTTSIGDNNSISRSSTAIFKNKKKTKSKKKKKRNKDNTMVNLPINSSFASLDSFYIENFAMTKLNQEDPTIFNTKFKSSSQPAMEYSPKNSQTDLLIPRTRKRRGKKQSNNFKIDSGNTSSVYLDDNNNTNNKTNSSLRVNIHDLNSQPSSRIPSNSKILHSPKLNNSNNNSSFSSNVSMPSNGSLHRELYKGRVSPQSPLHNDSLPKLSSIDKQLNPSIPSIKTNNTSSSSDEKLQTHKRKGRRGEKCSFNEFYTSTNENHTTSTVDSDKSSIVSDYSSSPIQPSYHVTSEDASIVSFRNMPYFPNMIPPESITSSMLSLRSSMSSSSSGSSRSSSSSMSSSSSFSISNSNSNSESESDSGEELILNIGNSGHMRRRQSQHTSKSQPQTIEVNMNSPQSNKTLPISPIKLKRNSSSSQHFSNASPRPSSTNLLQMSKLNEDNIITDNFISGELDSVMLLKDVLDNTPCNNNNTITTKNNNNDNTNTPA